MWYGKQKHLECKKWHGQEKQQQLKEWYESGKDYIITMHHSDIKRWSQSEAVYNQISFLFDLLTAAHQIQFILKKVAIYS